MEDAKLAKLHSNLSKGESSRGYRGGLGKSVATLKTQKSTKSHLYLGNFVREGEGTYKNWDEDAKKHVEGKKRVYGWIESDASQQRLDEAKSKGKTKKKKSKKRKVSGDESRTKKQKRSSDDTVPSVEFLSKKGKPVSWKKVCKKTLKGADSKSMKLKALAASMKAQGVDVGRKQLKELVASSSKFSLVKKTVFLL